MEEAKRRKKKLERGEQEKTNKRGSEGRGKKMGWRSKREGRDIRRRAKGQKTRGEKCKKEEMRSKKR
jgi:hypothetical protein